MFRTQTHGSMRSEFSLSSARDSRRGSEAFVKIEDRAHSGVLAAELVRIDGCHHDADERANGTAAGGPACFTE